MILTQGAVTAIATTLQSVPDLAQPALNYPLRCFFSLAVVSVHVPLTPETENIIDANALAQMKPNAILINAARGGLVDEDALLAALESGHLHGAGLDVYAVEPAKPDHPLLHREDVVSTPHIASATYDGKDRLWEGAIRHVLEVLDGIKPSGLVNQDAWPLK